MPDVTAPDELQRLAMTRSPLLRPISLLRLSLLRFVDSKSPGNSPMDMRIPSPKVKILLESDLRNPES